MGTTALGDDDPAGADKLRRASTHWLRHAAATHQAEEELDDTWRWGQANQEPGSIGRSNRLA